MRDIAIMKKYHKTKILPFTIAPNLHNMYYVLHTTVLLYWEQFFSGNEYVHEMNSHYI